MSFLDKVRADRQPLADVLKKHRGIRKLVEDLYPDRAHFIYELLQNAVDAKDAENIGATRASFALGENSVTFEHNGRPFSEQDIWGITDIGEGTKAGEEDKIGRFGVGFKAVFAYTETPHIWSPTFSFQISDLVLPTAIAAKSELGKETRFEFPFNNPKKSAQDAFAEVEAGLNELAETTLLFLAHLESIRWQIGQRSAGEVLRVQHSDNHIEVLKKVDGNAPASSHFLRFSEPAKGLDKQHVSVAFALDFLPNVTAFDPDKPLAKQLKIVPACPGCVSVFFPAEKETSGLRFHLHAPFVPELSRASIKETPANDPLFTQLADVAAKALHGIRDLKLLTTEFLGVLPNSQDAIPQRYEPVRTAIVSEMNNRALTPTHSKSHAPARHLLQAKASLKQLLSAEDIAFLVDCDIVPPQWTISATQNNSDVDRFLSGLAIQGWDIDEFVDLLETKSSGRSDGEFTAWIAAKPMEWHVQLYALLRADLPASPEYRRKRAIDRMKLLKIIRLSDGSYSNLAGNNCYFPSDGVEHDEILRRVAAGIYSAGKSKTQQAEAKEFLKDIGVRDVGEAEQVEAILKRRYSYEAEAPNEKTYWKDLKRFIALVEKEPTAATMFADFYIFERACQDWATPAQVFLDSPYLETSLRAYYDAIGDQAPKAPLSENYKHCGISTQKLRTFAESVGVQVCLTIERVACRDNPAVRDFAWSAPGGWSQSHGINQDYTIVGLSELLVESNEALSKLVWKTACEQSDNRWLLARFRNNSNYPQSESASQLVCTLRDLEWIPQTDGRFVRPSEASRELLPKGFPFDTGDEWLKAIHFGEEARKQSEEHKELQIAAERLGFPNADSLERAQRFAAFPQADQERVLAEFNRSPRVELPEHEPSNPERRAQNIGAQAADAPERITENRTRSVSVGREDVKREAEQYLRQQYTNPDGEMICQICKTTLPFKLDDGKFYFEKVEFLPELKKVHYQNYLALCPNHSAMFQRANGSRELILSMFSEIEGNQLEVVLAQENATVYFTKTHIADLAAVMEADQGSGDRSNSDDVHGDARDHDRTCEIGSESVPR